MTTYTEHQEMMIEARYYVSRNEEHNDPLNTLVDLSHEGIRKYGMRPWHEAVAEAYREREE